MSTSAELRAGYLEHPHPSRLDPSHPRYPDVMAAHAQAVSMGAATYRDPVTGYDVFTAAELASRGECCDNGCRHCPYLGAR